MPSMSSGLGCGVIGWGRSSDASTRSVRTRSTSTALLLDWRSSSMGVSTTKGFSAQRTTHATSGSRSGESAFFGTRIAMCCWKRRPSRRPSGWRSGEVDDQVARPLSPALSPGSRRGRGRTGRKVLPPAGGARLLSPTLSPGSRRGRGRTGREVLPPAGGARPLSPTLSPGSRRGEGELAERSCRPPEAPAPSPRPSPPARAGGEGELWLDLRSPRDARRPHPCTCLSARERGAEAEARLEAAPGRAAARRRRRVERDGAVVHREDDALEREGPLDEPRAAPGHGDARAPAEGEGEGVEPVARLGAHIEDARRERDDVVDRLGVLEDADAPRDLRPEGEAPEHAVPRDVEEERRADGGERHVVATRRFSGGAADLDAEPHVERERQPERARAGDEHEGAPAVAQEGAAPRERRRGDRVGVSRREERPRLAERLVEHPLERAGARAEVAAPADRGAELERAAEVGLAIARRAARRQLDPVAGIEAERERAPLLVGRETRIARLRGEREREEGGGHGRLELVLLRGVPPRRRPEVEADRGGPLEEPLRRQLRDVVPALGARVEDDRERLVVHREEDPLVLRLGGPAVPVRGEARHRRILRLEVVRAGRLDPLGEEGAAQVVEAALVERQVEVRRRLRRPGAARQLIDGLVAGAAAEPHEGGEVARAPQVQRQRRGARRDPVEPAVALGAERLDPHDLEPGADEERRVEAPRLADERGEAEERRRVGARRVHTEHGEVGELAVERDEGLERSDPRERRRAREVERDVPADAGGPLALLRPREGPGAVAGAEPEPAGEVEVHLHHALPLVAPPARRRLGERRDELVALRHEVVLAPAGQHARGGAVELAVLLALGRELQVGRDEAGLRRGVALRAPAAAGGPLEAAARAVEPQDRRAVGHERGRRRLRRHRYEARLGQLRPDLRGRVAGAGRGHGLAERDGQDRQRVNERHGASSLDEERRPAPTDP